MAKNDAKATQQEPRRFDTTERGGRYEVNGELVDATGKPLKTSNASSTAKDDAKDDDTK